MLNDDDSQSKIRINRSIFVKYLRELKNNLPVDKRVSTKQLAKRAGWSTSYAYHIVSQKTGNPLTMVTLSKICRGLGLNHEQAQKWIRIMDKETHAYQAQNQEMIERQRTIPDDIERLIRKVCGKKHWPLSRVAKNADMNISEVKDIRDGKEKDTDPITLGRLANALNIDIHVMFRAAKVTKKENQLMPVIGGGDLADVLAKKMHDEYMPAKLLANRAKVDTSCIEDLLKNKNLNALKYRTMKALAKVLKLDVKTLISARAKSLQEMTGVIKPAKRTPLNAQHDMSKKNTASQAAAPKNNSKDNRDALLNHALAINPSSNTAEQRRQKVQPTNFHDLRPDVLEVARKLNRASQIDNSDQDAKS